MTQSQEKNIITKIVEMTNNWHIMLHQHCQSTIRCPPLRSSPTEEDKKGKDDIGESSTANH